ncbi:MAG: hypothetical protein ACI9EF_001474 [Pseudohongiellaceae bacterium]|jgi:hypothetical protein
MSARRSVVERPMRTHPGPSKRVRSSRARRVITFTVLVSVGVGSLILFGEDPSPVRGSSRSDVPESPGVVTGESETTVVLGEMDFDISNLIEIEPGRFERRVEYTIRIEEGRPEDGGYFRLKAPHVTVMNPLTGERRGEVSAQWGRCQTNQSSAGAVSLSTTNLSVESFSLSGDVRGSYLLDDGSEVTLEAEQLDQLGDQLNAPGLVVWDRGTIHLAGLDMSWNQATGQLEFGADTEITLRSKDGSTLGTLRGAGGLVWRQEPREDPSSDSGDDRRETNIGFGSLRGPVTGELADGSTLKADHLAMDGDAAALTLTGEALLEQRLPNGWRRAQAEHITVSQDESGNVALIHAEGSVRLKQALDGEEVSWLEAESLTEIGGLVSAEGLVRWGRGDLVFAGNNLTVNQTTRQLRYASNVTMQIPADATSSLAGMTFHSPGGMTWWVPENSNDPWSEALGRFTGAVSGETPNGLSFRANALEQDGPGGLIVLNGDVHAEQRYSDGRTQVLDGQRIEFALGQNSELVDLSAQGDVTMSWSNAVVDGGASPTSWSLATEQLRVLDAQVLAQGSVVVTQPLADTDKSFSLTGVHLEYNNKTGHLELRDSVVIQLADGTIIRSPTGLVWDRPANPAKSFDQGSGSLRGPASGETPKGMSFRADFIQLDGEQERIALVGHAQVRLPAERVIKGNRLELFTTPGQRKIFSPNVVSWQGPLSQGEGLGLSYNMTQRLLTFASDVTMTFTTLEGQDQLELHSNGPLSWQGPANDTLPMWLGSGHIQGGVRAVSGAGQELTTDLLLLDGSTGRFDLMGPSHVTMPQIKGLGDLAATERITLLQDIRGEIVWLDAYGDVTGTVGGDNETFEYAAEAFLFDRDSHAVVLDGESRMERVRNGKAIGLNGDARTRLLSTFNELGELTTLVGDGRIISNLGSFSILSDSLNWDVPGDYMLLTGNCRVLRFGGEVETAKVEIWPAAWRWHVHPPATEPADG